MPDTDPLAEKADYDVVVAAARIRAYVATIEADRDRYKAQVKALDKLPRYTQHGVAEIDDEWWLRWSEVAALTDPEETP